MSSSSIDSATKLREDELDFGHRMIFGQCPVGLLTIDPRTGEVLDFNAAAAAQLGYSPEEFARCRIVDFEAAENPEEVRHHLERVLEIGSDEFETRQRTKQGALRNVLVSVRVMEHAGRKLCNCVFQDITALKAAERAGRENQEQLRLAVEQAEVQMAALKAAANGIVITDRNGKIEWVNDAFERITGYSADEVLGENPRVLKSGQHSEKFYQEMWSVILAGKVWEGRLVNRRKDGTLYNEEMTVTPMLDQSGAISHFIAVKQDISNRVLAEKQLLRGQRMESIGRLAGGIAHDLNNSLAPILMSLEWLKLEHPDSARIIEIIDASARRSAEMVKQLVSFARGAEGEKLMVQMRHVVKELDKIMRSTFPKNISVKYEFAPDLPPVLGDATQLHQVLLNLCVNARDAMPQGGQLHIRLSTAVVDETFASTLHDARPGQYLRLDVRDTGAGISPEVQDRMFEPFFTTKPPDKGSGLGLPTALGIVQEHGGFIRVVSATGQGACFSVYLPSYRAECVEPALVTQPDTAWRGHGETVLVVDDELAVRRVTQLVLGRLNFNVVCASDGAEGIARVAEHRRDLRVVITDLQMPNMDGLSFVRALRCILPEMPVVVTCGRVEPTTEAELTGLGVCDTLYKPFSEVRLKQVLEKALAARSLAQPSKN